MRTALVIIGVLTVAAVVAVFAYPPKRWWSRPFAMPERDGPVEFEVVETARAFDGEQICYGPWEPGPGWPQWGHAYTWRLRVPPVEPDPGRVSRSASGPPIGMFIVDWRWLFAELGLVVLAFGGALTWVMRRHARRRMAPTT